MIADQVGDIHEALVAAGLTVSTVRCDRFGTVAAEVGKGQEAAAQAIIAAWTTSAKESEKQIDQAPAKVLLAAIAEVVGVDAAALEAKVLQKLGGPR